MYNRQSFDEAKKRGATLMDAFERYIPNHDDLWKFLKIFLLIFDIYKI